MSKKISPIPRGYRTATPCLTVFDVDASVAFYRAAFGAELLSQHSPAEGAAGIHATIKIGNSMIALNQECPELGLLTPLSTGFGAGQIHLYVDDIDASFNRAIEAGAIVRTALFDAYWGDRTGVLADPNGQLWSIASKIENVSKDEINRRCNLAFGGEQEVFVEGESIDAVELTELAVAVEAESSVSESVAI